MLDYNPDCEHCKMYRAIEVNNILVRAAELGNLISVKEMVEEEGAEVSYCKNQADMGYKSSDALTTAISEEHYDIVKYLIYRGAYCPWAIIDAARWGNVKMLSFLLSQGFALDSSPDFELALDVACEAEAINTTKWLIEYGAKLSENVPEESKKFAVDNGYKGVSDG